MVYKTEPITYDERTDMPTYISSNWETDRETGFSSCAKHCIPEVPCPQCLATADESVQVFLTPTDRNALDFDPELSVRDLFPIGEAGDKLCARAT